MLRHNVLIILRNIKRNKSSFFINLIGLSTGLACALLIFLWVNDELHMDKFHAKDKQLYQVMLNTPGSNGIETIEYTPGLLAQSLAKEMPEVEYAASVIPTDWGFGNEGILSFANVQLKANEQYVSQDYFHIFSYRLLQGDINQVLSDKNSILISDEIAVKLFGSPEKAIGEVLNWERTIFNVQFTNSYKVSGVFEKPPSSSSTQFDLIFNYELFFEKWGDNLKSWTNQNPYTYLALKEGTNIEQFNAKIAGFIESKVPGTKNTIFVRPFSDKYLYNKYEDGTLAGGRITYVKLFSMLALFILAIGCINFMNLSTAQAAGRSKEVGIKKTIGAAKKTLIMQYLGESLAIAFLSMMTALLLVELLLPEFNQITGKNLSLNFKLNTVLAVLSITILTGLISGSYPAFYLSGLNTVSILKGKFTTSLRELWSRKGLVILQFGISAILIVSVMVVYKQIEFIQTKNLGFSKDNIIRFKREGKLEKDFDAFLNELRNTTGVINATNSTNDLTGLYSSTTGGVIFNESNKICFASMDVNFNFFETLGINIKEGRTFSKEFGSESSAVIFNETGIRLLGIKNPIGKTVQIWGKSLQIVGVINDFHFESLYEKVKPCFFRIMKPKFNFGNNIWVKIKAGTERQTITRIQKLYKEFNPGLTFEYKFLNEDFQALYEAENRIAVLSRYFAAIAIIISCLGLFGLVAFTAERRTKEIGVRKVLGATLSNIIFIISKDFIILVIVANVIALPLAYYFMNKWLQDFAYRIEFTWWMFALAGGTALVIALATVSFQAIKAATANPVESLKYE